MNDSLFRGGDFTSYFEYFKEGPILAQSIPFSREISFSKQSLENTPRRTSAIDDNASPLGKGIACC